MLINFESFIEKCLTYRLAGLFRFLSIELITIAALF